MADRASVDRMLRAEPRQEVGDELLAWALDVQSRLARGDMMIGLLGMDEIGKIPTALARAAECGSTTALLHLASWLADPPFGKPDLLGAEKALRAAIEHQVSGAALCLIRLRWFYRREDCSESEQRETYELARALVEENEGDHDALHYLGLLTCHGFGVTASPERAYVLQQRSAAIGNPDAMFEVHVHLARGLGAPRDDQAAFEANTRAAKTGHLRAMYNMGAYLASGTVVPQDLARAAEWYQRASDAGNPLASASLAVMYALGDGVEKDRNYAEELFADAENCGLDVSAMRSSVGL